MKKKEKPAFKPATIDIIVDGVVKESIPLNLANADPIRAGCYKRLAKEGDAEAQKKLEEMENTIMVKNIEEDTD
jgi:hypothetical protein